jgi:flagellar FliL protein
MLEHEEPEAVETQDTEVKPVLEDSTHQSEVDDPGRKSTIARIADILKGKKAEVTQEVADEPDKPEEVVEESEPEGEEDEKGDEKASKKKKAKKESGPMKLVIVGAIALFVAVLGAQVAAPILTKMIAGDPNAPKNAEATEGEGEGEQQLAVAEPAPPEPEEKPEAAKPTEPALYVPLDPPFVVSFADQGGGSRFVQLTLQAMARSEKTIDAIKTHAPAIRNAFLFVISGHKVEDLETLQGKEKLRAEMLAAANEIMEKNTGKADAIEELYFTSLVIQ